eukprot:SAG11_NODE_661_length_7885_cov_8.956974_9_plen_242_part_00
MLTDCAADIRGNWCECSATKRDGRLAAQRERKAEIVARNSEALAARAVAKARVAAGGDGGNVAAEGANSKGKDQEKRGGGDMRKVNMARLIKTEDPPKLMKVPAVTRTVGRNATINPSSVFAETSKCGVCIAFDLRARRVSTCIPLTLAQAVAVASSSRCVTLTGTATHSSMASARRTSGHDFCQAQRAGVQKICGRHQRHIHKSWRAWNRVQDRPPKLSWTRVRGSGPSRPLPRSRRWQI